MDSSARKEMCLRPERRRDDLLRGTLSRKRQCCEHGHGDQERQASGFPAEIRIGVHCVPLDLHSISRAEFEVLEAW